MAQKNTKNYLGPFSEYDTKTTEMVKKDKKQKEN